MHNKGPLKDERDEEGGDDRLRSVQAYPIILCLFSGSWPVNSNCNLPYFDGLSRGSKLYIYLSLI